MNQNTTVEMNFDGLVGPSHNYAGLAPGNLASQNNKRAKSNPRAAALQGLAKMNLLRSLGVPQGVLPPSPRPDLRMLRQLGFAGDDARMLYRAQQEAPHLLTTAYSSSNMWAANAATVCPSVDAEDGRVHFTPANLCASLHRAIETQHTASTLRTIFADPDHFVHHDPIPCADGFGDEGAANHTRLSSHFGQPGVQLFVYGDGGESTHRSTPQRFRPRQSLLASQSVARLHQLQPARKLFAKQNPQAIDAGVFHNDVIAVGHRNLFFCHELAFEKQSEILQQLEQAMDHDIEIVQVPNTEVSLDDAVGTYLFNSQIITNEHGQMVLIAPQECREHQGVYDYLMQQKSVGVFSELIFIDVKQSMRNGGGPACLRLRVELTHKELAAIHQGIVLDDDLSEALEQYIHQNYRDELTSDAFVDPKFVMELAEVHAGLKGLLGLR